MVGRAKGKRPLGKLRVVGKIILKLIVKNLNGS